MRRVMAEFNETQQPSELLAPDFVWDLRSWTGQAEYHGADGFREFFAEWTEAYEEWTSDVESIVAADAGQVVLTIVQHGRMRGSDSWVDLRAAFLYTIEDGLIKRIKVYESAGQALRAPRCASRAIGLSALVVPLAVSLAVAPGLAVAEGPAVTLAAVRGGRRRCSRVPVRGAPGVVLRRRSAVLVVAIGVAVPIRGLAGGRGRGRSGTGSLLMSRNPTVMPAG